MGIRVILMLSLPILMTSVLALGKNLDFTRSVIVAASDAGTTEKKAVSVLTEEIAKRTGIELAVTDQWPGRTTPVIAVGLLSQVDPVAGPFASEMKEVTIQGAEGFSLVARESPQPAVIVLGQDSRGALFGVGRLLRKMHLARGSIRVPQDLDINTSPKYLLRGHQLGYRPKTNAYDAWTAAQYDQYIRELAIFGSNSIEIMPPRTDDERINPLMKTPPLEMMIQLSSIIDSYGLDVWIWYPNMGDDYVQEKGIQEELREREEIFGKLKRIDHILVPGGDPGHLHPDVFFPWMDRVAELLEKYHPKAKIWVSPQSESPTREWLSSFYRYVNQRPEWLGGVAFAPWVKTALPELREIVSDSVEIRRYPDITHNVVCQYPVKDWDMAHALTSQRESYNPRPVAMKVIHNALDEYAYGSLTYSEGINDDVNKFVWGDQDWDPDMPVAETLRDYARFFISPELSDSIAQGFLSLERNWDGPLAANRQVGTTLEQWRDMAEDFPAVSRENYRFQMGLLRAYFDAYVQRRLVYETELEAEARDILRSAPSLGSIRAMEKAEAILRRAKEKPVAVDYKEVCERLADSLFERIGSQLTVERHGAQQLYRGASMDGIDHPLNDATWLMSEFRKIREIGDESSRLKGINAVLNRTNPGPGGFYDNMGSFSSLKRIVNDVPWEDDPGSLRSPRIAFEYKLDRPEDLDVPLAWKNQVGTIYETPLSLLYEDLDPDATYRVKLTYTGRRGRMVRLMADDRYVVHELLETMTPPIREFPVPREATQDGRLRLTWSCGEGQSGSQVSEIWLIKE